MRFPLRRQIMLPMAAMMIVTVVGLAAVGAVLSVRATKARIAARIDGVAQILEQSNFPLTDAVLRQMKSLSGAEMAVVDSRGRVLSTSGLPFRVGELIDRGSQEQGSFKLGTRHWTPQANYFHTVVPLAHRAGDVRDAALHVFYPQADYRAAWRQALVPSTALLLIALPVVMLLSGTTASRISRRMVELQDQVDHIAEGDFRQLKLADRDDEIRALSQAVNRMAAMLAQYEDEVRLTERMRTLAHLGGGIAHQLRNSATGCNIAIDLHAEECPIGNECESLEVAKRQLQLMEEYIERFLQIGKPQDIAKATSVDLAALIDDLLPLVQPAAKHARVCLEWRRPEDPVMIAGDPAGFSQLIINIVTNAIEAAAQAHVRDGVRGLVHVELTRENSTATFAVSDSGYGPPAGIAEQLFEPFVTAKTDGVGLGLSVARDVATHSGGSIDWQRAGDMTQFIVQLPCQQTELQSA